MGNTWTVADSHPSVERDDIPAGTTMRIIARAECSEWMRLADREWTYHEAQGPDMDEHVRDALCEALRNSPPP